MSTMEMPTTLADVMVPLAMHRVLVRLVDGTVAVLMYWPKHSPTGRCKIWHHNFHEMVDRFDIVEVLEGPAHPNVARYERVRSHTSHQPGKEGL